MAVAPRYGWHRDELYFREAGRHLAWGYRDQPPFTPFVALVADAVAPGSLLALRLLPAVATGLTVVLGALIARELGAPARAQVFAAAAVATAGFVLGVGHLLATATFDLLAWMALLWLTARLLRTGDGRIWLPYGAVAGIAMLNKNLVVLLALSTGVGLLAGRRWDVLRTPWLPFGAVLAAVLAAPNLIWQAQHGWPQQAMARALEARIGTENRVTMLPLQVLFVGLPLVPSLARGALVLWRSDRFRPLVLAWPAAVTAALVSGGRPYYVLPLTLVVAVAGVAAAQVPAAARLPWLLAANGIVGVVVGLPVLPVSQVSRVAAVNEVAVEQLGWPELAQQVHAVVAALPEQERRGVVLLTGSYGEAGAIDLFGPPLGLPPAHSPHNGYADFRRPRDEKATVVAVRMPVTHLAPHFARCEQVGTVDNGLGVENEVQGAPVVVCRGLVRSWAETWERLRFLS